VHPEDLTRKKAIEIVTKILSPQANRRILLHFGCSSDPSPLKINDLGLPVQWPNPNILTGRGLGDP